MPNTISAPITERAPTEESLTFWAQREVIPFMKDVRRVLNSEYNVAASYLSTASGIVEQVFTGTIPTNRVWDVTADAVAISTTGTFAAAAFSVRGLFYNNAGVVGQVSTTSTLFSNTSDVSISCALAASGSTVTFGVQDNSTVLKWKVRIKILFTDEQ